jgi:recyclin-1
LEHGEKTASLNGSTVFEVEDSDEENDDIGENGITNEKKKPKKLPAGPALDLHLSLDVALLLIHTARSALARVAVFDNYPGHYGGRVRDATEELFVELVKALGEGHVQRGFERATAQMRAYKPEGGRTVTTHVAPLLQFFELVHVGDTIASMVQVYFDKELV